MCKTELTAAVGRIVASSSQLRQPGSCHIQQHSRQILKNNEQAQARHRKFTYTQQHDTRQGGCQGGVLEEGGGGGREHALQNSMTTGMGLPRWVTLRGRKNGEEEEEEDQLLQTSNVLYTTG